ncbi:hypothetical protein Y10_10850 [Neptunitalea sp. Y10]|uniref:T9SS type A sorting domain-containing protein n=1 Tax=Neptunitalea lumnitzerae TaxID=2965509 RepID=A0ABQ5MIF8_9FLAO|nr:hypothetical protein Y10_10850 [Neptunitalea sp. Y10]
MYAQLTSRITLENQVAAASTIVEGKILHSESFWDANQDNIYTLHTVEVIKKFKGLVPSTIQVVTAGGTVGLNSEEVFPALHLSKQDVGMFMLQPSQVTFSIDFGFPIYEVYSDLQGFYQYNSYLDAAANSNTQVKGIATLYANIMQLTGVKYNVVTAGKAGATDATAAPQGPLAITQLQPLNVTAGTATVITINGTGFGNTQGFVKFKDSNTGGLTTYTALDSQILSWSNTEIKVEVPAFAGSGLVQIQTSSGSSMNSLDALDIVYAETNVISDAVNPGDLVSYPNQHISVDNGGYLFQLNSSFASNSEAFNSFKDALEAWTCGTQMNWKLGVTTNLNTTATDGISLVRFDNGNELPVGILGRCTVRSSGCFSGSGIDWYVTEMDLRFDDATNWNFSQNNPSLSEFDFESIALHELGHGRLLNHVIDTQEVMHYAITQGEVNRTLSVYDIDGGVDIHLRSTLGGYCSQEAMMDKACINNVTSVNNSQVFIYPNPANDVLYIDFEEGNIFKQINLYDASGRRVYNQFTNAVQNKIDVSLLSTGLYVLELVGETDSLKRKLLIE